MSLTASKSLTGMSVRLLYFMFYLYKRKGFSHDDSHLFVLIVSLGNSPKRASVKLLESLFSQNRKRVGVAIFSGDFVKVCWNICAQLPLTANNEFSMLSLCGKTVTESGIEQ